MLSPSDFPLIVEYCLLGYNTMQPDRIKLPVQWNQLPPPSGYMASQPAQWFSSQTLLLHPPVSPCAVSAQVNDVMLCYADYSFLCPPLSFPSSYLNLLPLPVSLI